MKETRLFCSNCKKEFSSKKLDIICDSCGQALEVETISGKINDENPLGQTILQRYAQFYPYIDENDSISLGEGFTPLVESKKLAEEIGIGSLYFKNETQNPTWSFKDRGTLVGVLHAKDLGYKRIGTVSTGNMAVSVAAYGAKAGLETFVLVKKGMAEEKMNPIAIYGPHLIKVDGEYGKMYFESLKIGLQNEIYFINSDVPFRVEGYKTLAYEICEQLDFEVPDYVVVPTSAGGNIRGILKGFEEFKKSGYIKKLPVMVCAQASGCSPIVKAYENGEERISRFENPETIAHAIENPFPPSGNPVLSKLGQNKGLFVSVTDEEIIRAQADLSKEGLFVQPASAVSLASVRKLKEEGKIGKNDSVSCVLTGSGLKYTAAFEKHELESCECRLDELSGHIRDNY